MSVQMEDIQNTGGLCPEYKSYERQKCFVGHSREAEWHDDILGTCAEVLPKFDLEPWYASDHFDPTKPLRDKVVELIANARYGIYDLSSWQDKSSEWHLPRNVLIELGMAIALNRPALLLHHTSNKAIPCPVGLQGVDLLEFAGETTLKKALEERLPQWFDVPPDREWLNRFCIFGNRVCDFREEHPRARQWGHGTLRCHISDGFDKDRLGFQKTEREEIRGAFEDVFSRYSDLAFDYLDELPLADGYQFTLCSHCQTVRSTPFAVYHVLPHASAEVFIAIGMSIAMETLFEYDIPKIVLVRQEQDLPSLLRGYEVVEAINSSEVKRKLKAFVPAVMQKVRETAWKPRPLPFVEISVQPYLDIATELSFDLDASLQAIVERAVKLLESRGGKDLGGAFFLCEDATETVRTVAQYNLSEQITGVTLKFGEGVAGRVVETGETFIINDYHAWEGRAKVFESESLRSLFKSIVQVPVEWKDKVIGVLAISDKMGRRVFDDHDVKLLQSLANNAAIAVENARLKEWEERIEVIRRMGLGITAGVDPTEALTGLLQETIRLMKEASVGEIWLLDGETGELKVQATQGDVGEEITELGLGKGVVGHVAQSAEAYLIGDVGQVPYFVRRLAGTQSELAVPLLKGDQLIGVLNIEHPRLNAFSQEDIPLLEMIASQVVIALENVGLEKLDGGTTRLMRIREVMAAISTEPSDLAKVLHLIVESLSEIFWKASCAIRLYDSRKDEFGHRVAVGPVQDLVDHPVRIDGTSRYVVQTQEPLYIENVSAMPPNGVPMLRHEVLELGIKAAAYLPLLSKGDVIGILYVDLPAPHWFSENEKQELKLFSDQAATAIENVRSYEKAFVATFGLSVEEVLESEELPPNVPTDYPYLCDWLEEDLQRRLHDRIGDFQHPEASKRDGEILSVRIAFQWRQQDGQPDFGDLGWWSLLELASFEEVYSEQDAADFWGR